MPELAETLRISTDISDLKLGNLKKIELIDSRCLEKGAIPYFKNEFKQESGMVRWMGAGKYVALVLHDARIMTFRLGMSGRFIANQCMNDVDKKHIILSMFFENGILHYVDYRKFSRINVVDSSIFREVNRYTLLYSYESDITNNSFEIKKITKKPKISEMLSEGTLTGIGNYLANESLATIDFNPYIPFDSIDEKKKVYLTAQRIATDSYIDGGNTFNGGYKRVSGKSGKYKCKYYGNESYRKEKFNGRPIFTRFERQVDTGSSVKLS